MTFHALISGILTADPQQRIGAKGPFTTATIRAAGSESDPIFASAIPFGPETTLLLGFTKGDAIEIGGRAKLNTWTGRDGTEKHGISITVSTIASATPAPRTRTRPAARKPSRHRETSPTSGERSDR
jgi:hypothetical protein